MVLVRIISAVVVEVAHPALGDAAAVFAGEVAGGVAHLAVLLLFIRVVAAVVLAITPDPVRDAPVVGLARPQPDFARAGF